MTRTPLWLALALAAPLAAAPKVKEKQKPPAYLPTAVGATWVFTQGTIEETETVTAVETKGGTTRVRITTTGNNGALSHSKTMVVGPAGVGVAEQMNRTYDPPWVCLPANPKPGDQWEEKSVQDNYTATLKVAAAEKLDTPAGKFETLRVEVEYRMGNQGGMVLKGVYWHAPEFGMVQSEFNGQSKRILKSFTPGKK